MNITSEQPTTSAPTPETPADRRSPSMGEAIRSAWHWIVAGAFFFPACAFLLAMGAVVDPRKNDAPQRAFTRIIMRLAGAKLRAHRAAGYDPQRTCFFMVNHVNLFDPFVLYSTIPQFFRGLELESHFHIPVYGWMMKRFGNVPVPDTRRPSDLKRMWRLTRAALDSGVSLAVFPEGQRTLDGHVGPFEEGVFRMAVQFGVPIIPVSLVGAFEFNTKTNWLLRPGPVDVYLHDVIETKDLRKEDVAALRDRVHAIISAPVEQARKKTAT